MTNAQYKSRYARDDAIRAIARELTISTQEVKDKVRTLRTYYNSERRKTTKRKTGSAGEKAVAEIEVVQVSLIFI